MSTLNLFVAAYSGGWRTAGGNASFVTLGCLYLLLMSNDDDADVTIRWIGWAVFPWECAHPPAAWIHSQTFNKAFATMEHEIGHSLGLLHTFSGYQDCDGSCAENCDRTNANDVGDFCADTPATPLLQACFHTPTKDCVNQSCSADPSNWMNYAIHDPLSICPTSITLQQTKRMHCWFCGSKRPLVIDGC
jgi:hypothetical protein